MRSGPEKGKPGKESSAVSPIPPLVCFLEPRPGALCSGAVGDVGCGLRESAPTTQLQNPQAQSQTIYQLEIKKKK